MKCREAKQEIALHFGHDESDPARLEEARRHVATCAACRVHCQQMKESMAALGQAAAPPSYRTRGSLWPALAARLDQPKPSRWNWGPPQWLPVLTVAAACMLFGVAWIAAPMPQHPQAGDSVWGRSMSPLPEPSSEKLRPSWEAREADRRANPEYRHVREASTPSRTRTP